MAVWLGNFMGESLNTFGKSDLRWGYSGPEVHLPFYWSILNYDEKLLRWSLQAYACKLFSIQRCLWGGFSFQEGDDSIWIQRNAIAIFTTLSLVSYNNVSSAGMHKGRYFVSSDRSFLGLVCDFTLYMQPWFAGVGWLSANTTQFLSQKTKTHFFTIL